MEAITEQLMTDDELAACEAVIERGKQTFIEVGNALREIRDRKGYRGQYKTFSEYCRERWGFAVRSAYRMIDATETIAQIENVTPGSQNLTEKQVRPITTLPAKQQVDFASQHNLAAMTSREIEEAVKEYKEQLADAERRAGNLADELERAVEDMETLKQANRDLYEKQQGVNALKEEVEYLKSELAEKRTEEIKPEAKANKLAKEIQHFVDCHSVIEALNTPQLSDALVRLEKWLNNTREVSCKVIS